MSSEFMRQIASVLEKVAEHIDQQQYQEQETARIRREQIAQALNEKYAAITGEELSPDVLERMSDETILRAVEKLTEKTAAVTTSEDEPEKMGEGANIDNRTSLTRQERVKQAAADAEDSFLNWIMD